MYYLQNSRINNYSEQNKNRLMYFQLEVDYYSNEANKNFDLTGSTKSNLNIAEK